MVFRYYGKAIFGGHWYERWACIELAVKPKHLNTIKPK